MVIRLDDSLRADISKLTNKDFEGLQNIALAGIAGYHFVLCPHLLGISLSQVSKFSLRERTFYSFVAGRYGSMFSITNEVDTYINIIGGEVGRKTVNSKGQVVYEIPVSSFSSIQSVSPSKLLCEDLSDCEWVIAATKAFLRFSGSRTYKVSFDTIGGGGNNIPKVFDLLASGRRHFVLCIVDSDKKSNSWKLGDTAKSALRAPKGFPNDPLYTYVLPCHELENLIPDDLFQDGDFLSKADLLIGNKILEISNLGFHSARLHIDIKIGLLLKDLLRSVETEKWEETWKPLIEAIENEYFVGNDSWITCAGKKSCAAPDQCRCQLVGPLGRNVLARSAPFWDSIGTELWKNLPDYLKAPLEEVAKLCISWGCALPPVRVV